MNTFEQAFKSHFAKFHKAISSEKGDWTVKGFIDIYQNIYTISIDTKVVSKIIELMIFPVIVSFARENNYILELSNHQNHYPDITFIDKTTGEKIALDIKSTYRISQTNVNGMTLGAFTGYFRNRNSTKNIKYPYNTYSKHYILGVLYTKTDLYEAELVLKRSFITISSNTLKRLSEYVASQGDESFVELENAIKRGSDESVISTLDWDNLRSEIDNCIIDERRIHGLDNLQDITSVVRDFDFFLQEKWKIASDQPGSGNTKNIGSLKLIDALKEGEGIFKKQFGEKGKEYFDDYWMYYMTRDMAEGVPPYKNLKTYLQYKSIPDSN
jgi:Restriction endonuclease EcoRV